MKAKIISLKNNIKEKNYSIFIILSIVCFFMFSFIAIFGDELEIMHIENASIIDCWQKAVDMYYTWASRILVNFVVFLFTGNKHQYWWAAYMALSLFVLMYSFSYLFGDKSKKSNIVIAGLIMLFPFQYLDDTGWIATMTTYLSPTAFGFLSLIPIKKILNKSPFKWWHFLLFSIALIYGANNEQMMVVILGSYFIATVYFIVTKHIHPYCIIQLLLAIGSLINTFLCPGNWIRKNTEYRWFAEYDMFNTLDKIDLGYSTTMKWIFYESHIYMMVCFFIFAFLMWKKKSGEKLTFISFIPFVTSVLLGPFRMITTTMFPNIAEITDLDRNGLVTVVNRGNFQVFCRYAAWAILLMILIVTLIQLQSNLAMLLATFTLIGTGLASRIAIGFSSSLYASGNRTFTCLSLCVIGATSMIYSKALEEKIIDQNTHHKFEIAAKAFIICSLVNLACLIK